MTREKIERYLENTTMMDIMDETCSSDEWLVELIDIIEIILEEKKIQQGNFFRHMSDLMSSKIDRGGWWRLRD